MNKEAIIKQALASGPKRTKELEALGVSRATISKLAEKGVIERMARGLYSLDTADLDENQSLLEVCKQAPGSVICLLSALQYYGMTTELPHKVWIAIERKSREPAINYPPVQISWFSGDAYNEGIKEIEITGGTIRIYSPAKTVADCFKYRNKIGMDVAIAALKDCWKLKLATVNEIYQYARTCKVEKVIRPYLEAIVND